MTPGKGCSYLTIYLEGSYMLGGGLSEMAT